MPFYIFCVLNMVSIAIMRFATIYINYHLLCIVYLIIYPLPHRRARGAPTAEYHRHHSPALTAPPTAAAYLPNLHHHHLHHHLPSPSTTITTKTVPRYPWYVSPSSDTPHHLHQHHLQPHHTTPHTPHHGPLHHSYQ